MRHSEDIARSSTRNEGAARKPYHKPEVRHERVFETMALSCGKQNSSQAGCKYNKKLS
jgi:hypothetical protein